MNFLGWLSVLLVLVNVGRLHDSFARYTGAIPAGKILLLLGLLAFLLAPTTDRLSAALKTTQGKALLIFSASLFLSVPNSYYRSASLELAMLFVTGSIPIILITVAAAVDVTALERLFRAAVLLVVMASAIIAGGFGVVYYGIDGARTTLRGSYDPNDLALVISSCMAFCLWAIKDRSMLWRLLGYAGLVGGAYVVQRTYSRGGAIALGTLVLLATFAVKGAVPAWFRAAILPLAFVGLLVAPPEYRARLYTLGSTEKDYNSTAETGRVAIWKRGIRYFIERPITGVGAGQFTFAEGKWGASQGITAGWKWSAPHNMYVESAAELGILGIGGVLGMLIPTLRRTWRRMRSETAQHADPRSVRAAGAIFLAVSTFMVGAFFLTAAFSPLFVFLTALGMAYQSMPLSSNASVAPLRPDAAPAPAAGSGVRRSTRWQGRPAARVANRSA